MEAYKRDGYCSIPGDAAPIAASDLAETTAGRWTRGVRTWRADHGYALPTKAWRAGRNCRRRVCHGVRFDRRREYVGHRAARDRTACRSDHIRLLARPGNPAPGPHAGAGAGADRSHPD